MNVATFAGRVGQDAELKYTQSGKAVASFSLAINQGKDGNGEERAPLWIKATIWEKRAEALAPHIKKGSFAIVSGPVSIETWANKNDGSAQGRIIVTVREFTFGGGSAQGSGNSNSAPASKPQSSGSGPITDDDIPF